jgi:hypothetical protein
MFPWPVRVFVLWPLAALQLILLTMGAFGFIEYSVEFTDFMRWLGNEFADFFAPLEDAIRRALAWIGITLPKLGQHWHNVFVLIWLVGGASARIGASNFAEPAALLSAEWFRQVVFVDIPLLLWAGFSALVFAALAGILPPNRGISSAFLVGTLVANAPFIISRLRHESWPSIGFFFLAVAAPVLNLSNELSRPSERVSPFGIENAYMLLVVALTGFFGLYLFVSGLLTNKGRERLTDPRTVSGLDILGSYAIALTLAALFGKYTLG